MQNGHLFGQENDCYFNPYSASKMNEKVCMHIDRPNGVQIGRGSFLIHEAMGLRDDYDYFLDIRASIRKAAVKFQPRNTSRDASESLTWNSYSSGSRKKIFNYMYTKYPFLFHFRDKSGEDCWAVKDILQQYLSQAQSYSSKKSRASFLRRNASANDKDQDDDDDDDVQPDESLGDYEDDYALNSTAHRNNPDTHSASAPRNRHSSTIPAHDGYQVGSRDRSSHSAPSGRNRNASPAHDDYEARPNQPDPAPKPTANKTHHEAPRQHDTAANARDICRADKIVAMEEEREQAAKAGPSKNHPSAPTKPAPAKKSAKAKGKQPERQDPPIDKPRPITGKRTQDGAFDDDSGSDDEEVLRKSTKKVRQTIIPASPDASTAPAAAAAAKTTTAKPTASKSTASKPTTSKSTTSKSTASKSAAAQPTAPKTTNSKATTTKTAAAKTSGRSSTKDVPEPAAQEIDATDDAQPGPAKRAIRPKMRPVPPSDDAEETEDKDSNGEKVVGTHTIKIVRKPGGGHRMLRSNA